MTLVFLVCGILCVYWFVPEISKILQVARRLLPVLRNYFRAQEAQQLCLDELKVGALYGDR